MLTRRFFRSSRSSTRSGKARGASRPILSLIGFGLPLLAMAQGLTSCGDDDGGAAACTPGDVKACVVPGNSCGDAVQTCNGDGSAYSACACGGGAAGAGGSAGSGGGGTAGAAGSGGGGDEPLFPDDARAIGAPCESDADCPTGPNGEQPLTCITASSTDVFGTGGPQGGFCTIPCTDTTECQALDTLGACSLRDQTTGNGYCIGVCLAGSDQATCLSGERAQACFDFGIEEQPGLGGCLPVCESDAACGDGLVCDFGATGLGLCTSGDNVPVGTGTVGDPCTEETALADCKSGVCLTFDDPATGEVAAAFCSANCTFGILPGCGFGLEAAEGTRDAACLLPQAANGGSGDIGLCIELCDQDSDCQQDDYVCVQDLSAPAVAQLGRLGECVPPFLLVDGGGADAGTGADAGN